MIVRGTDTPIKEERRWRIGINREIKDISQWTDIVKFTKSLRLRYCGCIEMDNERVPKQVTGRMEGVRKCGRPRKNGLMTLKRI